jgi:hypothetical protein
MTAAGNVGVGMVARAGNGLDKTRTDALVPQPETGKIDCVHHPRCGRLSPGAHGKRTQRPNCGSGPTHSAAATVGSL